jgi:dephospho-CoA kinase
MITIGLTGSIAMGKSTVAQMFADAGIPYFDADKAVHHLYQGSAVAAVESMFPGVSSEGNIDRERLARAVLGSADALARLEGIVHPLVQIERDKFLVRENARGRPFAVLEIPLLLEAINQPPVDLVVVVSASASAQQARALARVGMTRDRLGQILARQSPDAEKRGIANWVIDTSRSLASTQTEVADFLRTLSSIS